MQHLPLRRLLALSLCAFACFCLLSGTALAKDMIPGQSGSAQQLADSASTATPAYSSSDASVVKVNASTGALKAKKAGSATVTLAQGNRKKTLSITVYPINKVKANKPTAVKTLKITQPAANTAQLSWGKSSNASGYVVYSKVSGSYVPVDMVSGASAKTCKLEGLAVNSTVDCVVAAYKKVTVTKKVKTKVKVKSGADKGKTKTVYKKVKVKQVALAANSPYATMVVTDDNSALTNASSVIFARKQITIVRKSNAESSASIVGQVEGKKLLSSKLRYSISNSSVASVDKTGVVTSKVKKSANCTLTVTAHNGVSAKIKVKILSKLDLSKYTMQAHRGDANAAPENTIAAFCKAAENGFKAIEFDVWETYSGDLVISHNKNLQTIYGVDMDVREVNCDPTSSNYIGNFKAVSGSNVSSYGALTIPTFEDVVRIAAAFNMSLDVHLKNPDDDVISQEGLDFILSTLERYGVTQKSLLAVQTQGMVEVVTAQKQVPVKFVITLNYSGFDLSGENYDSGARAAAEFAAKSGCSSVSLHYVNKNRYTTQLIDYIHSLGLTVGTWDIDSVKRICYSIDVGIDELTTDTTGY